MEKVSVIIPVFNEEETLFILSEKLKTIFTSIQTDYEVIFVDDGSSDRGSDVVEQLHQSNPRYKLISLSRNFGHQAALSAGLEFADGDAVIMMDGDLQHPPELIPELIRKWKEGFDIVYTVRKETADAGIFKRCSAAIFYQLINSMTRTPIPAAAADFRLIDRAVVEELRNFKEQSPFLRGIVSWVGFRQTGIVYNALPRYAGTSGYSLGKMIRFAVDGITAFSSFPLRVATFLGFIVSGLSFIYGIYAIFIGFFTERVVHGWVSLMVMVLFLGGVQLITLGILGEYVGRIYDQVKGRPRYIVQKKVGNFEGLER